MVVGNSVYFGCEDGKLYSVSTVNGNVRWATQLGGPVKAAPAYYGGRLYVGDYGGDMNAVDAKNGELVWQTGSLGTGVSGGEFYSTPAVAFGRVYAGNNDDRVYSFDLSDGELAWTYSTGGYAYSGPTVASTKHSPPTVYIGSFDGNIYALNAKNGEVRWSRSAGGQVVGSLSAIGEIVYVAEFTNQTHERLHDAQRPQGLHLPEGHLHADHHRRPGPLPDRLLEHHQARADPPETRTDRTRHRRAETALPVPHARQGDLESLRRA